MVYQMVHDENLTAKQTHSENITRGKHRMNDNTYFILHNFGVVGMVTIKN